MRTAKAQDWRRRISQKAYKLRIDALVFKRVVGIGSGTVPFNGAITAICGANGVGKTTLLQSVLGSLDARAEFNPLIGRMQDAELEASLTVDGEQRQRASKFQPNIEPVIGGYDSAPITKIDPGADGARLISLFSEVQNLDELLEPLSPAESDEEELSTLSYMVGRQYSSCKTYEIEDYNDQATFPYFVVESWASYGSEHMGLGELSLFLMYWHLKRIPEGSILLIEEPETHISPQSQRALLDVIAKFSTQKSLWIILTTHSPGILADIPLEHIRLLSREGGAVMVNNAPTRSQLNSILGIGQQFIGALLVEDRAAREFARTWINHNDPEILRWVDFVDTGSEANTVAALSFPRVDSWLRFVGIFDGDARSRITELYKWPYAFLPGNQSPERTLREVVVGNSQELAAKARRHVQDVAFVLSEIEGRDPHDWFEELHKRLGLSYEQLMTALFSIWVDIPQNGKQAKEAFDELVTKLGLDN